MHKPAGSKISFVKFSLVGLFIFSVLGIKATPKQVVGCRVANGFLEAKFFPQVIHNKKILEAKIRDGLDYILEWKLRLYQNIPKWYKPHRLLWESTLTRHLIYSQLNGSFIVSEKKQKIAFANFRSAYAYFMSWEVKQPLAHLSASNMYFCNFEVKSRSLKLFWPLSVIYRNFVSKIDFFLKKEKIPVFFHAS